MPLSQRQLQKLCQALREADPDIIDIIQFGSSVYAPDLARDIDILVTTRAKKDDAVYWDALADDAFDDVDLMVKEQGEPWGRDIALSVVATGQVLHGDGETLTAAEAAMAVPTYEDAQRFIELAEETLQQARQESREWFKDKHYRSAFNLLFEAARHAAMAFLVTENNRWGQLRKMLPRALGLRFRDIVNTLHIQYWYEGNYPKDDPDAAFHRWREEVVQFIDDLKLRQTPS